jgi:hypothetical protein
MSEPVPPIEREDEGADDEGVELQFDQAELATPAAAGPSCAACKRPIQDAYYEINGKIVCNACRQHIEASLRGGSGLARFLKASVFGFVAAFLGAALYFIITRTTGLNIGLVAILVGFMIGGAVRKGTANRGGLLYQFLALFLTYFAIGLMGLTFVIEQQIKEFQEGRNQAPANPKPAQKGVAVTKDLPKPPAGAAGGEVRAKDIVVPKARPANDPVAKAPNKLAEKDSPIAGDPKKPAEVEAGPPARVGLAGALLLLAAGAVFVVVAAPVITAVQAPISGLIYCFALLQAWRMNKGARLAFNGPFQVAGGGAAFPAKGP